MSDNSGLAVTPATLPAMKAEDVKARAQRILDLRGTPPYKLRYSHNENGGGSEGYHTLQLSEDEAAVLSEFVQYWLPYLTIKEKSK